MKFVSELVPPPDSWRGCDVCGAATDVDRFVSDSRPYDSMGSRSQRTDTFRICDDCADVDPKVLWLIAKARSVPHVVYQPAEKKGWFR